MIETIKYMNGKWKGKIESIDSDIKTDLIVEIGRNSLKVIEIDNHKDVLIEEENGTWDWVEGFLIFSKSNKYYIRRATSEKLIFGKLKSDLRVSKIDWQTELKPTNS